MEIGIGVSLGLSAQFAGGAAPAPLQGEIEYTKIESSTDHTFPLVSAGDMLVVVGRSVSTGAQTATSSTGQAVLTDATDLQQDRDGDRLCLFYMKAASAAVEIEIKISSSGYFQAFNLGNMDFVSGAAEFANLSSGPWQFPTLPALPERSMILYYHGRRTFGTSDVVISGTGTLPADPTLPSSEAEYSTIDSRHLVDIMQWPEGGDSPDVSVVPTGGNINHAGIVAAFVPGTPVAEAPFPGQYVADDNGAGLAASSTLTEFESDGTTFTMSEATQVGNYITGNRTIGTLWVRPPGGTGTVTIDSYPPGFDAASRATGAGDGGQGNGAMVNPGPMRGGLLADGQGLDGLGGGGYGPLYNDALRAVVPITLSPGDVLVVAQSSTRTTGNSRMDKVVYIHCVADIPYDDEFAPPYMWPDPATRPRYRASDIAQGRVPSLSTSGLSFSLPQVTDLYAKIDRRMWDPVDAFDRNNMWAVQHPQTYGRDIQRNMDEAYAYICTDAPWSVKELVVRELVQRGIDHYGVGVSMVAAGIPWNSADGGHSAGRLAPIVIAGHLLGDATMRDWVAATYTPLQANAPGEYGQRCYISPDAATASQEVGWSGAGGSGPYVSFPDEMGQAPRVPDWCGKAAQGGGLDPGQINNTWDGPSNFYRTTGSAENQSGQVTALLAMGLREAFGQEAYFDYYARHFALNVYGDDPWRYVGGSATPRYDLINNAPAGSGGAAGSWNTQFFQVHCWTGDLYLLPPGVNSFEGCAARVDSTAPILSGMSAAFTAADEAVAVVTTDEAEVTLYQVWTDSATAPTAAQVKAGQDHTGAAAEIAANQPVSQQGAMNITPATGLSTATHLHLMQEDFSGNQSAVLSAPVQTIPAAKMSLVQEPAHNTTAATSVAFTLSGVTGAPGRRFYVLAHAVSGDAASDLSLSADFDGTTDLVKIDDGAAGNIGCAWFYVDLSTGTPTTLNITAPVSSFVKVSIYQADSPLGHDALVLDTDDDWVLDQATEVGDAVVISTVQLNDTTITTFTGITKRVSVDILTNERVDIGEVFSTPPYAPMMLRATKTGTGAKFAMSLAVRF